MAIKEVEKEKFSWGPVILMGVLVLILAGIGFGIYSMISGPKTKTITLTGEQAQQAGVSAPNTPVPAGPAFPALKELTPGTNPGATLVTLDLKNATAQQVAAEIAKQTGQQINVPQQGDGGFFAALMQNRFDFSVSNQPFWTAIDELGKKSHLTPQMWGNERSSGVTLQNGGGGTAGCPTVDVGAARLILTSVTTRIDADLVGGPAHNRSLTVSLMLYVEPKVKAYRLMRMATVETAVDEKGQSLIRPRDPWDERNGGGQRSKSVVQVECRLNFPQNAGDKIAKLKGYASIITVGKDDTVAFKDPLKNVNVDKSVDGQPIRLKRLTKSGPNGYQAEMSADAYSPIFSDWESLNNMAKLVDASGKEYPSNGNGMGSSNKTVDLYLSFNSDSSMGSPTELRVTMPTQVKEIRVPFEFTDLPLPH